MSTQTTKIAVTFPQKLIYRLRDRAGYEYGFNVPEMLRKLAVDYIDSPVDQTEYLSAKQETKYLKDIKETKSLLRQGKISPASSVKQLKQQITREANS